jgi:hypothetical protein
LSINNKKIPKIFARFGIIAHLCSRINLLWLMSENEKRELRERAAIAAMQGLLTGIVPWEEGDPAPGRIARVSCECADALVKELCKQPK